MSEFGVYIHLPFCRTRCRYCDFFSTVTRPIPHGAYLDSLLREWGRRQRVVTIDDVASVYLGGGTPSLWPPSALEKLLRALPTSETTEVSVEVNPKDVSWAWLDGVRRAGVNRISVGVQSLADDRLRFLGRRHDGRTARDAVILAGGSGFSSVSVDVIYGTPGQTPAELAAELTALAGLPVDHISAYELTVAWDTPLGREVREGSARLPEGDAMADLWLTVRETLSPAGLEQYEVSSYARPGRRCRHNEHYWRGGQYVGLGLGAHGFWKLPSGEMIRYHNGGELAGYLGDHRAVPLRGGMGDGGGEEVISLKDYGRERLMLGLRTTDGVNFRRILDEISGDLAVRWRSAAAFLVDQGWARMDGEWLRPTGTGLIRADTLAEEFF